MPAIDRDLVEVCADSQQLPKAPALDSIFYRKVEGDPIAALRFLGLTRDLLFKEMKGAHDMVLGLDPKALGSHVNQFTIRNFFRTLVNYIEATADAYGLYLQQAKARGGIALAREAERRLNYKGPLDRLVATCNIFSARVGAGNEIEEIGVHRRAIEKILGFRNRLTHPETSQDLFFEEFPAHLLILDAMGWISTSLAVTEVDPRKFLDDGFNSGTARS